MDCSLMTLKPKVIETVAFSPPFFPLLTETFLTAFGLPDVGPESHVKVLATLDSNLAVATGAPGQGIGAVLIWFSGTAAPTLQVMPSSRLRAAKLKKIAHVRLVFTPKSLKSTLLDRGGLWKRGYISFHDT